MSKQLELFPDLYPPTYIYESPDGGETIYRRECGNEYKENSFVNTESVMSA